MRFKFFSAVLCLLIILMPIGEAFAAWDMSDDFSSGSGIFELATVRSGMAVYSDGQLQLGCNVFTSGLFSHAKATTAQTVEPNVKTAVYFTLEANSDAATTSFGVNADDTDYPVFSIKGDTLSCNGDDMPLTGANDFTVIFDGSNYFCYVNGSLSGFGALDGYGGGAAKFYFKNLLKTKNTASKACVDDFYVVKNTAYSFSSSVEDGGYTAASDGITLSFEAPLLYAPTVAVSSGGVQKDAKCSFFGNSALVTIDGAANAAEYELTASNIYTLDGTLQQEMTINFTVMPAGYAPPDVTLAPDKSMVKKGEYVTISYSADSAYDITSAELYVDGSLWDEAAASSGSFSIRLEQTGEYEVYVRCYDSLGGHGDSGVITLTVPGSAVKLEFDSSGTAVDYDSFDTVTLKAESYADIEEMKVYANGEETDLISSSGGTFVFGGFSKNIGDMKFCAEAIDKNNNIITAEHIFEVVKSKITQVYQCDFETGTSNFANATLLDITKVDGYGGNATTVTKITALDGYNGIAFNNVNCSGLKGVYDMNFEVYLPSGASVALITRGLDNDETKNAIIGTSSYSIAHKAGGYQYPTHSLGADRWYNIRYVCDSINGRYSVWVNGNELTSPSGNVFYSPFKKNGVASLRALITLPAGKTIYWDNIAAERKDYSPVIDSVNVSGRVMDIKFSDAMSGDSMIVYEEKDGGRVFAGVQNIELLTGSETVSFTNASYNSTTNTLTLEAEQPLVTGAEYLIKVSENAKNASADLLGVALYKYFKAQYAPFDITDFRFVTNNNKVGISATVQNTAFKSGDSVVAVMLSKAPSGAITAVYSSDVVAMSRDEQIYQINISPVIPSENNVEVFFMDNWEDCRIIKNMRYSYSR